MTQLMSRAPVVSIASIRGRATGVGSELSLACDMRFASHERAILSQWEVGAGLVPGGGPMARLPRLMGRGRALEVLLGADDIPGDLAELYGYVNRALPDFELDAFVDALAIQIASFDKQTISDTKRLANGPTTKEAFAPGSLYEFKIDTHGDAIADISYSVCVQSSDSGKQTAMLRSVQGAAAAGPATRAKRSSKAHRFQPDRRPS